MTPHVNKCPGAFCSRSSYWAFEEEKEVDQGKDVAGGACVAIQGVCYRIILIQARPATDPQGKLYT